MNKPLSFRHITDAALIDAVTQVAASERRIVARLVALLAELDRRRLHLGLGYSSLFEYCVKALRLTEHETYNRIEAARAIRRHPSLLTNLAQGDLSLTTIRLLAPHLTHANLEDVVSRALGQGKEEVKQLVASLKPQPPVPSIVRKLPELKSSLATVSPCTGPPPAMPGSDEPPLALSELLTALEPPASRRPVVTPLSEAHYKLQVTISAAARERLKQIQDLMRHRIPSGDPATIVEHALEALYAELLKKKAAEVAKPRRTNDSVDPKGRHIPASVKRAVWRRDEGRCAFVSDDGRRCGSTSGVEFHHVRPFAVGGASTSQNIEMRCRAHNGFEWERHLDQESVALACASANTAPGE